MKTSELIYNSWVQTQKPIIYKTKDAKGNETEKEVDFLPPQENKFYDPSYKGKCNMCGKECTGGIPAKKLFSSNYMDWAIHKEAEATHVCESCSFCIGMNPVGRIALFRYPIVAEKELHLCNRGQFRDYLISPPEPPFIMIFPTSQKKHLFAKSKISYSKDKYFCNFEEITININPGIKNIIRTIEALRGIGFRKDDIKACSIPGSAVKKYEFSCLERLENVIKAIKENEMFNLCLEVSGKEETEDAECYLDLKLKTK